MPTSPDVPAGLARPTLTTILMLGLAAVTARAQDRPEFPVERTAQPPKIDGVLDDDVWQRPPLPLGEWLSYNPLRGDTMPADLPTEIRVAYDDRNLYFAFHCIDPDPDRIRTTVARRDTAFNDDWIAVSLDSASTGQTAYHLYDSAKYRLLTDASASYEFVPGTVFHAGYGSLYERNATADGSLVQDGFGQTYLLVNRGLFFNASYVHRF
jgi:cellulose/xylan binding protein with CBM9 domain